MCGVQQDIIPRFLCGILLYSVGHKLPLYTFAVHPHLIHMYLGPSGGIHSKVNMLQLLPKNGMFQRFPTWQGCNSEGIFISRTWESASLDTSIQPRSYFHTYQHLSLGKVPKSSCTWLWRMDCPDTHGRMPSMDPWMRCPKSTYLGRYIRYV